MNIFAVGPIIVGLIDDLPSFARYNFFISFKRMYFDGCNDQHIERKSTMFVLKLFLVFNDTF